MTDVILSMRPPRADRRVFFVFDIALDTPAPPAPIVQYARRLPSSPLSRADSKRRERCVYRHTQRSSGRGELRPDLYAITEMANVSLDDAEASAAFRAELDNAVRLLLEDAV